MKSETRNLVFIVMFISLITGFTAWVSASSLGYQQGYTVAVQQLDEKKQHQKWDNMTPYSKQMLLQTHDLQQDMMIKFTNLVDLDFAKLMQSHYRSVVKFCKNYQNFDKTAKAIAFKSECKKKFIPQSSDNILSLQNWIDESGLK
jgi:hypothetical protein